MLAKSSPKFRSVGIPNQLHPALALPSSASPPWKSDLIESRQKFREYLQDISGPIPQIRSIETLFFTRETRQIPLTLYRPTFDKPLPLLIYIHGGGFVFGEHDQYHSFCARLANDSGCSVASIGYGRAPEHPFPQGLEDCRLTYSWLIRTLQARNIVNDQVALVGDSAGGNLVTALCTLATQGLISKPQLAWIIYPILDLQATTPSRELFANGYGFEASHMNWFRDQYISDETQMCQPLASPGRLSAQTIKAFPKTLIQTAGFDILKDEAQDFANLLDAGGNLIACTCYEEMTHGFIHALDQLTEAHMAIDEGVLWLRRILARG